MVVLLSTLNGFNTLMLSSLAGHHLSLLHRKHLLFVLLHCESIAAALLLFLSWVNLLNEVLKNKFCLQCKTRFFP